MPVTSPGLLEFRKGISVNKQKIFCQGSVMFHGQAIWLVWFRSNNGRKGAVACSYHEGGITEVMFCHQNSACPIKLGGLIRGKTVFYGI